MISVEVGAKKRQTSFRLFQSLREVLTKRSLSAGLAVHSRDCPGQVTVVKAMSTTDVMTDISQHKAADDT